MRPSGRRCAEVRGGELNGAFSVFMVERGSKRAVWVTGARVAAGASTRLVAMTGMGLTGWGLVFLAVGLVFEVGVVLLTPDALQKHVQKSYFGKGGDAKDKYQNLADEEKAIRDMTDPLRPTPKPATTEDVAYSDPMTGFMVAP